MSHWIRAMREQYSTGNIYFAVIDWRGLSQDLREEKMFRRAK